MTDIIKLKRNHTNGVVPTTSDLVDGEVAINTADKKIFMRVGASIVDITPSYTPTPYLNSWQSIDPDTKANKNSPSLTGTPTAPTAAAGSNTNQLATTQFANTAAAATVIDSIANGDTTHAPSRNAVFDALATKANDSGVVHLAGAEIITGNKSFSADVKLNNSTNLLVGEQSGNAVGQIRIEDATAARIGFTTAGSRRYTVGSSGSLWTLRDESGAVDRLSVDSSGVFLFRGGEARVTSLQTQFGYVGVAGYTVSINSTAGGGGTSDLRLNNTPAENRWLLRKNGTAETGSDVGSDLQLYRYRDSGSASVVLDVSRATGVVDFTATPTIAGNSVWHAGNFAADSAYLDKFKEGGQTSIPTAVDLDTYTTPGIYHQSLTANAAAGTNYPTPSAGMLVVYAASSMVYQTYQHYSNGQRWHRSKYNSVWSEWRAASIWGTARTLTLGSTGKSVDGSANVSWSLAEIGAAAASHTHTMSQITDLPSVSSAASTSTIVQRNASGYVYANFFNTTTESTTAAAPTAVMVETGSDGFIRKQTLANLRTNMAAVQNVSGVASIYKLTQAAYDAIGTKDANTLYVIVG